MRCSSSEKSFQDSRHHCQRTEVRSDGAPPAYHVKIADGSDLFYIDKWLRRLGRYRDDAYRAALEARAAALVKKLWPEIQQVAHALLKHKTLTQAQVRRLMNRARRHPRRLSSFRARRTKEFDK
jgi:hypothetical protein